MAERPARTGAGTRHARGMLALAQLDHVARVRVEGRTQDEVDGMIEVLAESGTHLLAE